MSVEKPTVIRHEHLGLLIWSPKLDSYFLSDKDVETVIKQVLFRKKAKAESRELFEDVPQDLTDDLITIGFGGAVREISNSLEHRLSSPLDVYFDYTQACNLRCGYCYNFGVDRTVTMPNDKIEKVFIEMSGNGIMRTHLAGGEPMINFEGLRTYLETATNLGMNASVNSNGTVLTEKILDLIFANDVITLTFSLDGHNSQVHDRYRGKGNFEKTRSGAIMSAKEKKLRGSQLKLQYKTTHFFDTPLEVYDKVISLAIEDGLDRVQFHNPECSIDHPKKHYSRPEVVRGYYERIMYLEQLRQKYLSQIDIWTPWNPMTGCRDVGLPDFKGCIGGQELIAIDAEGNMRPCLMNRYHLGNLFSDWNGDFHQFWKSSKELSNYHATMSQVDTHCDDCEAYSQCRGGRKTRIIVMNRDGQSDEFIKLSDMLGYDPYCAKDFLTENGMSSFPLRRRNHVNLNHFKQIFVAHSL